MTQTEQLLKSLNEHNVRYIIIGATAFSVHGWTRATQDIDLFVSPDEPNLIQLRAALTHFGYDISDATLEDFKKFKILFRQYDLPLDIHPKVAGIKDFEDVWAKRITAKLGDIETNFVSLDDLILMKRAAGREKDLFDLKQLEKLKEKK